MKEITYDILKNALDKWPHMQGKSLMVHSSLSSFGMPIKGGAQTVINALCDHVGRGGILMMPTLSFSSVDEKNAVMDLKKTPSDCGLLTQTFLEREDVYRSSHIVSSAGAWGNGAKEWVSSHYDTPCGKNSPYEKLVSKGGYVLFMGTDFSCNTLFHAAEEAENPSYLRYATIKNANIMQNENSLYTGDFRRYDCYQTGVMRYLEKMETIFEKEGVLLRQRVGNFIWTLITAYDDFSLCCRTLRENVDYLLAPHVE